MYRKGLGLMGIKSGVFNLSGGYNLKAVCCVNPSSITSGPPDEDISLLCSGGVKIICC